MEWYIILIIVLAAILVVGAAVFIILKINKNNKIKKSEEEVNQKVEESASHLALCFGGNDNIVEITQTGSRVTVLLEDPSKVNKEEIAKELSSVMYMGKKVVFVIGSKSEDFSRLLQENINKTKWGSNEPFFVPGKKSFIKKLYMNSTYRVNCYSIIPKSSKSSSNSYLGRPMIV